MLAINANEILISAHIIIVCLDRCMVCGSHQWSRGPEHCYFTVCSVACKSLFSVLLPKQVIPHCRRVYFFRQVRLKLQVLS